MRTIVFASACFLFVLSAGCDGGGDGAGGSGGSGGSGAAGGSGGSGGSGATGGGGSGAAGGSTSTPSDTGGGGSATTTSTTDTTTGGAAKFAESCTMNTDCEAGLLCYNFNAKGMLCTKECSGPADCPAPSSGCNGMGYCKPD